MHYCRYESLSLLGYLQSEVICHSDSVNVVQAVTDPASLRISLL